MTKRDVSDLPDQEIARRFVQLVTGQSDPIIRVRMLPEKEKGGPKGEASGTIAELWPSIVGAQARGLGVFWLPNLCAFGSEGFARDANATGFPALFCDFDHGLPTEWHRKPDIIVRTREGHGHAYWCIALGAAAEEWKEAQRRLIEYYSGADPAIKNPSRLMRLPGTLHQKGEANLVTFESSLDVDARTLGLPSIEQVVDGLPVKLENAAGRNARFSGRGPIAENVLRAALSFVDPNQHREKWRDVVAAIRSADVLRFTHE